MWYDRLLMKVCAFVLLVVLAPAPRGVAQGRVAMTVYKSPTCGCCAKWIEHASAAGFAVTKNDLADNTVVKNTHGVPAHLRSCHTTLVGGYVVEGHVPADIVRKLLRERPKIAGIAVPGMPMGSPGMEGARRDRYDIVAFDRNGQTSLFATR